MSIFCFFFIQLKISMKFVLISYKIQMFIIVFCLHAIEFQDKNLDWFPRMRAMSLVAEDSEGEQNEIRNLHATLDSTNRLVKNLTKQLTELREQVN